MGINSIYSSYIYKKIKSLTRVLPALHYLKKYRAIVLITIVLGIITTSVQLSVGMGIKVFIDQRLSFQSNVYLDNAIYIIAAIMAIYCITTCLRYYLVSWMGYRLTTDIRKDIYKHTVCLAPGFF